jgi:NAD(P)-dependent dehydrogenase (short-subunit alcohol dehydrogenase family)
MADRIDPVVPATAQGAVHVDHRLEGRRILVVGGGRQSHGDPDAPPGNGQAVSVLAAAEGARVAVVDRDEAAAAETVELIGEAATAIVADVSDPDDCERVVALSDEALGGLDGVVLNVGVGFGGLGLEGIEPKWWDKTLAINLRAHALIARHALPRLPAGAAIVFVSSIAGLRPGSRLPAYDASKAALLGLSRHVALEGSRRQVRSNVVCPGLIDTPLGRQASAGRSNRDRTPIPLGRQGTAWEVARVIVFVLSDEASYITGQALVVDGGLTL